MAVLLPKLFLKLPGDDCKSPRDGLRPCKTEDMLFLAALLTRAVDARYFLELADCVIVPEPAGIADSERTGGTHVKSRISRATIRRWFRDRFFVTRRLLAGSRLPGYELSFMGKQLKSAERWKNKEPWTLGKSLKWPFEEGYDPLLSEMHKIPFLSWEEIRSLKKREVYCPLDGPVAPVKADLITPPWTWRKLVGRHWGSLLCPNCLGQFQVQLIAIN